MFRENRPCFEGGEVVAKIHVRVAERPEIEAFLTL